MQLILNLELAGAQEVVRTLVDYLQDENCTLTVGSFLDGPLRPKIEALGVPVILFDRPRYDVINLPMFLLEMRRIRQALTDVVEQYQIDLVQTHLLEVLDFVTLSLRQRTSVRAVLWTVHNVEILPSMPSRLLPAKRLVYRQLYRHYGRQVDGFLAVSEEVRQAIINELGTTVQPKIFTINNGVDVRRYQQAEELTSLRAALGLDEQARLIITVGRLTEQKGQTYLIDAAPQIIETHPETHFLIVGEGELRSSLLAQVIKTGYTKHFHFLGNRQDVPNLLATAELFVLPSLWEGLSIALLEAMAAGKPIVATAVAGTNQVMLNHQTGLIVPPTDSPALAQAICQLLAQPDQAQMMGQAAQQQVITHYSAQKQAEEHRVLYQKLLKHYETT